jgi:hypothetical protein
MATIFEQLTPVDFRYPPPPHLAPRDILRFLAWSVALLLLASFLLTPGWAWAQDAVVVLPATPGVDAPGIHPSLVPITGAITAILGFLAIFFGPKVPSVPTIPVNLRRPLVMIAGFAVSMLSTTYAGAPWLQSAVAAITAVAGALGLDIVASGPHPSTSSTT